MTLIAGVVGDAVAGQSVPIGKRRRAEARSADLRQLSSSLLSELDEAIKQLPGSTGVQKLLVTRVLEHLDRMAKDAQGDRQTQLDLVDAYTRLGNIQGNAYDQNLGDPAGRICQSWQSADYRCAACGIRSKRPRGAACARLGTNSRAAKSCGNRQNAGGCSRPCGMP